MLERYSRLRLAVEMANDKQVGAPAVVKGRDDMYAPCRGFLPWALAVPSLEASS
jgi:hypothetical protein